MKKVEDINLEIKKIIEIRTKKKIKEKDYSIDLYKKRIVDSFDIISLITEFEKKFSIKIDPVRTKNFIFSIKFLSKILKKKFK